MTEGVKKWLPHIENSLPKEAFGYTVSMYSIALEGWRRGLSLKFINNNRTKSVTRYCLKYKDREHCFTGSMGDKVSNKAVKICGNKNLTKEYLIDENVPVPKGKKYDGHTSNDQIIQNSTEIGYPLVLKPIKGMAGKGVIANIQNEQELREALNYVREELLYLEVIIENHAPGQDYRLYVVGGKFVGAIRRIPANITGDGMNTIRALLKRQNKIRNSNPALFNSLPKVDKEMKNLFKKKGYSLESIPSEGEVVFLKSKSNISSGGDPIDVTDEIPDEIKEMAINAAKAIPGLNQGGIDIILDKQQKKAVVLEVNTIPSIRTHLFPMIGNARDVPKAIIDYYFPETIENTYENSPLFYFDIGHVFDLFQSGLAKEISIPRAPTGNLFATRFVVTGTITGVNYGNWVRKQARNLNLNGYIKFLKEGRAAVIVGGTKDSVNEFRKIIKNKSSKRAKIKTVTEKNRKSPIKVGFEIIA